jgi:hypothetical protein
VAVIILFSLVLLAQVMVGYGKLERTLQIYPRSPDDSVAFDQIRDGLLDAQNNLPLLSQYADITMSGRIVVNPELLPEKLAVNTRVARLMPIGAIVYRQALLLAQDGQLAQAKIMLKQAIWSYPGRFPDARRQLLELAEKDSVHFSTLLKFAEQTKQEQERAVHNQ